MQVRVLQLGHHLTNSAVIWQWREHKRAVAGVFITGGLLDNTYIHIWIFIWKRLALEQMSSHGRMNNPSISLLSPFSALHSLLSHIHLSCNHHFNASFPLLHFHPLFPSRLRLCFLISADLLLFPLNAVPHYPFSPQCWCMEGNGRGGSMWLMSLRKKINNHRRLGAGSWP